jgi:hypothetical protein
MPERRTVAYSRTSGQLTTILLCLALQDIAALLSRGASEAQREVAALKQQQMNLKLEAGRLTRSAASTC